MWWRRRHSCIGSLALFLLAAAPACGDGGNDDDDDDGGEGGEVATGGTTSGGTGGKGGSGGSAATGGTTATGGTVGSGGSVGGSLGSGGSAARGGTGTGGTSASGGSAGRPSGPLPDLFFDEFYAEDYARETEDGSEDGVYVEFAVANQGEAAAPQPHRFSLVISKDETLGNGDDIEIYSEDIAVVIPPPTTLETFGIVNYGFVAIAEAVEDGTYYVGALIDRDAQVVESDETNNVSHTNTIFVGVEDHDIAVTALAFDPAELVANGELELSVDVTAVGNLPVDPVPLNVVLSTDATLDDEDVVACSGETGEVLDVGEEATIPVTCVIPRVRGAYYVGVVLDPAATLAELDRENNVLFTDEAITVDAPDVDLTVTAVSAADTELAWQDAMEVSAELENSGTDAAGALQVGFYLSADASFDEEDDTLLCRAAVTELAAGGTAVATRTCDLPPSAAGDLRLIARVDDADVVFELDETNNTLAAAATLTVEPPDADIAYDLHNIVSTGALNAGATFMVTLALENPGSEAVSAFDVAYYFSTDATITDSDDLACVVRLNGIPASSAAEFTFGCEVPELAAGQYYTGVVLDPENEFPETNESNNRGVDQSARTVTEE